MEFKNLDPSRPLQFRVAEVNWLHSDNLVSISSTSRDFSPYRHDQSIIPILWIPARNCSAYINGQNIGALSLHCRLWSVIAPCSTNGDGIC